MAICIFPHVLRKAALEENAKEYSSKAIIDHITADLYMYRVVHFDDVVFGSFQKLYVLRRGAHAVFGDERLTHLLETLRVLRPDAERRLQNVEAPFQ